MKFLGSDTEIRVSGHNVDLGEALPDQARDKIRLLVGKYFNRLTECQVTLRPEGSFFHCSVNLKIGALSPFSAHGTESNIYRALDTACHRLSSQLFRRKVELRDDAARRLDKEIDERGEVSIHKSRPTKPEPDEPPPALDAYALALGQKMRQDNAVLEREAMMAEHAARGLPMAAE